MIRADRSCSGPRIGRSRAFNRLGRFPATTVRDLEIATVVGRKFDLRVVTTVIGEDLDTVAEALEAAVLTGLVTEDPRCHWLLSLQSCPGPGGAVRRTERDSPGPSPRASGSHGDHELFQRVREPVAMVAVDGEFS
jgi:hypothetical protein